MKLPVVDMSRWHVPTIDVRVLESASLPGVDIHVSMMVKNVVTGEADRVHGREYVAYLSDKESFRKAIRRCIHQRIAVVLGHELDECLYIDGERLCKEPHPERKP